MGLLVSATEAAFLCGCSDRTIRRYREEKRFQAQCADSPRRTHPAKEVVDEETGQKHNKSAIGPTQWLIDIDDLAKAGLTIIEERLLELKKRKASPARVKELETENARLHNEIARLNERIDFLTRYDGRYVGDMHTDGVQTASRSQAKPLHADTVTSSVPALRSRPAGGSTYQRKSRRTTDTPDLPVGFFPLARLADAHNVPPETVKKERETGKFVVTGPYKNGRNANTWAVDRENALKALRYWFFQSPILRDQSILGHCTMPGCPCGELRWEKP